MNASNPFSLKLFGSPTLVGDDGLPVVGPAIQRHRVALLALLALAPRNVAGRDWLMAHLWPESDLERARSLLNQAVYQLRRTLGDATLVSLNDELGLDIERIDVDVVRFTDGLAREETAAAVALYRGPLMDGFHLGGAAFDEWLERHRGHLAARYGRALESLAEAATAAGDHAGAVTWWRARADHDPYDSRVAVRLMEALGAAGNPAGALLHARKHEDRIRREFGIDLPAEVAAERERLRTRERPPGSPARGLPTDRAVASASSATGSGSGEPERGRPTRTAVATDPPGHRESTAPVRPSYVATAVAAALAGAAFVWLVTRDGDQRWLEEEAVPAIERALDTTDWESAFVLASRIEERVPDSPELRDLWPRIAWMTTLESEPSGATVFRRAYDDADGSWVEMGRTPLIGVRVPYGLSVLRFELEGYRPLVRALGGGFLNWPELRPGNEPDASLVSPQTFRLDTEESLPADMVRVPGWRLITGADTLQMRDFFLDRYEVTNEEYRRFVEAGGYARPELWSPIVIRGDTVSWDEAMARFVDRTGRPGPSTWEGGTYATGRDEYPVSGVSWFEADAFARFAGRELPTAFHWERALANATFPWLLPASNFGGVGPRPVTEGNAMSFVAAYDLAGNVREWTSSALGQARVILGGNWNDPYYVAGSRDASAFPEDRSEGNGIRLARTADEPDVAARVRAPVARTTAARTVATRPVSDSVYRAYARVFDYDRLPLNDSVESVYTARLWRRERVSFDAAYGPERVVAYVYIPQGFAPPYQTVVYWPGWDSFALDDADEYFSKQLDFVVKSGRAVAFPIYRGSFERRVGEQRRRPDFGTAEYRDNTVHGVKDLRRTLDYLETRTDLDHDAFAFFGYSWGGVNGPVALAQEDRFQAAVIDIGLIPDMAETPEVDPTNALPRVRVPTLLLSGEFDPIVPRENARRYFDLLGVDAERKQHIVAIGGHYVPRPLLIRGTLDWLDRWVGVPRP